MQAQVTGGLYNDPLLRVAHCGHDNGPLHGRVQVLLRLFEYVQLNLFLIMSFKIDCTEFAFWRCFCAENLFLKEL